MSGFLALLIGVFLVSTWRRRRKIRQTVTTPKSVVGESATQSLEAAPYEKPELHATERALFELDGKACVPAADRVEELADGELEDRHASSIARERDGRSELPEGRGIGPLV